MRRYAMACAALALASRLATATPTTAIWNPSVDVQAKGVLHLGIDNYFSVAKNNTKPVGFATDVGLTYGLPYGFEVGIDYFGPQQNPFTLNAKWALPEKGDMPAFALGVQGLGTNQTNQLDMLYGLVGKSFGEYGRLSVGAYYSGGKAGVLVGPDKVGVIATWDKAVTDKWWVALDYASGQNTYGCLALGAAYKFTPKVSVIGGYCFFLDDQSIPNDTATVQVDIDF
ncbi:MAG: hypothetical protein IT204_06475 [Fimbriimonadaceae bacterium]|nr:hypothetical protein [Fimbriimonadaceae bacterium]